MIIKAITKNGQEVEGRFTLQTTAEAMEIAKMDTLADLQKNAKMFLFMHHYLAKAFCGIDVEEEFSTEEMKRLVSAATKTIENHVGFFLPETSETEGAEAEPGLMLADG